MTTGKPVESQVIISTTQSPTRFTNRFKFVSRKPFLKTTTSRKLSNTTTTTTTTTDQTLDSTNYQSLDENPIMVSTEASALADIATALQKIQQAPIPQAKPSRKRPQILRISSPYNSRSTSRRPTTTSEIPARTTSAPFQTLTSPNYTNKKTVAIAVPFLRGSYVGVYSTPQSLNVDVTDATPSVRGEIYSSSPQAITAQDFVNKYTHQSTQTSTRSRIRYSTTTDAPLVIITPGNARTTRRRKLPPQAFKKVSSYPAEPQHTYRPQADYDYYDNIEASVLGKIPEHSKVLLHSNGIIECLDQGNFPHPISCKKFISCAKMDSDKIVGWEYTCPKNLSFDPIGGMCNWSAGLGCNEA